MNMLVRHTPRIFFIAIISLFIILPVSGYDGVNEWRSFAYGNFSTLTNDEIDESVYPFIENDTYTGLVIILMDQNGSTIRTYGVSNRTSGSVPDDHTIFELGSISKTFTGLLLADAEIRGVINLSEPIRTYVPEGVRVPSYQGREITLSDLATHTSGLPNVPDDFYRHIKDDDPAETQAESTFRAYEELPGVRVYEWLSNISLNRSPGESWEYSNAGTVIAGDIVSRLQNRSYHQLVEDRILTPLRMNSTSAGWRSDLDSRAAVGYRGYSPVIDEGLVIRYNDFWSPTVGIVSDADDMVTYLGLELGLFDSPLSEAVNLSQKPRALRSADEIELYQSLFWDTFEVPEIPRMHLKSGETNRFNADIAFIRDKGIGVVVLSNTAHLEGHNVENDIAVPLLIRIFKKEQ